MDLKEALKAGDEIQIQIAPYGDYPAYTVDGKEITQRFDRESFENIIKDWTENGAKMIRADFDHASEMTDDTIASGWIKELAIDDEKGLVGTLVVSESGANALNGLDYRFGSPVFAFDETEHPVSLLSFAFTNRPRLENMDAVWNSKEKTVVKNDGEPEKVNIVEDLKNMDELKKILGLPDEAVEEDIVNAVKEMVDRLKAIADEEIQEEAEEIVNECGLEGEQKEEVVNSYKQNPALVKTVLNCFKKTPVKKVVNAEEAVKPELTDDEKLKREYASLKGGKDKVDFLRKHPGMKL